MGKDKKLHDRHDNGVQSAQLTTDDPSMAIELFTPYKPSILKTRILIREYANIKLSDAYLTALTQELQSLKNSLSYADRIFNESLSNMSSTLDDTETREYLNVLNNSTNESATNSSKKELKKALETLKSELEATTRSMKAALGGFETATISDYSGELSTLASERLKLLSNLPSEQKKLTAFREQHAVLEKAILEYQSKTFIDSGQPIIEELKTAVTDAIEKPSEKSKTAVKAGMNIAQNLLNIANERLKYTHLVEARDKLAGEISIWQSQMNYEQRQVDIIDNKNSQLMALIDVIEPRKLYVTEGKKTIDMIVKLINSVFNTNADLNTKSGLINATTSLLENYPKLPAHLDSLAFYWLRD